MGGGLDSDEAKRRSKRTKEQVQTKNRNKNNTFQSDRPADYHLRCRCLTSPFVCRCMPKDLKRLCGTWVNPVAQGAKVSSTLNDDLSLWDVRSWKSVQIFFFHCTFSMGQTQ